MPPRFARSLADNQLCGVDVLGRGTYTTVGMNALFEALKGNSTLTSLKYASQLESIPPSIAYDAASYLLRDILNL